MAHGDTLEGNWRGNWRMEWVASALHTTSEYGVSSITTADAHTSAASSRLNWRPCRFKWTRPFRRKTKSVFCACAITFQTQSNGNICSACVEQLLLVCWAVWHAFCLHSDFVTRYNNLPSLQSVIYWSQNGFYNGKLLCCFWGGGRCTEFLGRFEQ